MNNALNKSNDNLVTNFLSSEDIQHHEQMTTDFINDLMNFIEVIRSRLPIGCCMVPLHGKKGIFFGVFEQKISSQASTIFSVLTTTHIEIRLKKKIVLLAEDPFNPSTWIINVLGRSNDSRLCLKLNKLSSQVAKSWVVRVIMTLLDTSIPTQELVDSNLNPIVNLSTEKETEPPEVNYLQQTVEKELLLLEKNSFVKNTSFPPTLTDFRSADTSKRRARETETQTLSLISRKDFASRTFKEDGTLDKEITCTVLADVPADARQLSGRRRSSPSAQHLICQVCGKILASEASLIRHTSLCYGAKERSIRCSRCGRVFKGRKRSEHLKKHVKLQHPEGGVKSIWDRKVHSCDECGRKFVDPSYMKQHKLTFHQPKEKQFSVKCEKCDSVYTSKASAKQAQSILNAHIRQKHVDGDPRTYPCQVCAKAYKSRHALKSHFRKKHDEAFQSQSAACPFCDKKFNRYQKTEMECHINMHKGLKTYPCPDCAKPFRNRSNLNEHRKHAHQGFVRVGTRMVKRCERTPGLDVESKTALASAEPMTPKNATSPVTGPVQLNCNQSATTVGSSVFRSGVSSSETQLSDPVTLIPVLSLADSVAAASTVSVVSGSDATLQFALLEPDDVSYQIPDV